jgi:hypothetical protein
MTSSGMPNIAATIATGMLPYRPPCRADHENMTPLARILDAGAEADEATQADQGEGQRGIGADDLPSWRRPPR